MADIVATVNTDGGADYTSLSAAEAGERATYADLVTDNNTMTFDCEEGSVDTTAVTIASGWITSATYDLTIKTDQAERHDGTWSGGYRLEVTGATALTILTDYSRLVGLAIKLNLTAHFQYVINDSVTTHYTEITHCFLWATGGNYVTSCIRGKGYPKYGNNILISDSNYNHDQNCPIFTRYVNGACYVYNNTLIGGRYSIYGNASLIAINNIFSGAGTQSTIGTFGAGGYNVSDDATDTGSAYDLTSMTFTFVNAGSDDYHLNEADAGARGYGTILSADGNFPITDGIDGNTRSTWDCGADEVESVGSNAVGGIISTDGLYTVHTFKRDGVFTPDASMNIEAILVAGGGGGGSWYAGGGGGGGGKIDLSAYGVTATSYNIIVGRGGYGGVYANLISSIGNDGDDTTFDGETAVGGGGGGAGGSAGRSAGRTGGSGGGGAGDEVWGGTGGSGTVDQGHDGGEAPRGGNYPAGGGGGAGAVGVDGVSAQSGKGGVGESSSISGSATNYSGGGGSAYTINGATEDDGGDDSAGDGGTTLVGGTDGVALKGGGGGGSGHSGYDGGDGGSGIVIIRYLTPITGSPWYYYLQQRGFE